MSSQPRQSYTTVRRNAAGGTTVMEQGLRRAFPLEDDSTFDALLIAIDMADENRGRDLIGSDRRRINI